MAAVCAAVTFSGLSAPPAHAASIVQETTLLGMFDDKPVPQAGCDHVPGVARGAKIWASTYVTSSLGRYAGVKFSLWTRYRGATATAIEYTRLRDGAPANCNALNSFDRQGSIDTLYTLACTQTPRTSAVRPNYWCAAADRWKQGGIPVPPQLGVNLDKCGVSGIGWASWHNQHIKLTTTDVWDQLGLGWIPGHLNIDSYIEDFDMLMGVSNIDTHSLQPVAGDTAWKGYGKTLTAPAADKWAHLIVSLARSAGIPVDPMTHPGVANDYAQKAIAYDHDHPTHKRTIDMAPTPVNAFAFKNAVRDQICASSPWIADSIDKTPRNADGSLVYLSAPVTSPTPSVCSVGFAIRRPQSSNAIGQTLKDFVASQNDGKVPPDLKSRAPFIPMIVQEAFSNRDKVNPMLIKSPADVPNAPGQTYCKTELNLGVSRGTPLKPNGDLNVDVRDPHFVNLIKNLGDVLG